MFSRDSKVDNFANFLFLLIIIRSGLLAEIRWSVCMSKSHRSLCVSFSRTGAGLCIYHLFVASYQRLLKWHLIPPCLTLGNIRYVSRVKRSNPGKREATSPSPWCSSYWKGSLLVALDYSRQLYFLIIRSGLLAEIRWSMCISKSHRSLCVSFSRTGAGLCIYHLFVGLNLNFLHISQ